MQLNELFPFPEERKQRRRVGRGKATGWGCTAGKGNKGQNARSGGGVKPGFEGGQMPIFRRLPKRGFKNFQFKTTYAPVNLSRLEEAFPGKDEITLQDFYDRGLVAKGALVKVLGDGDVSRKLTVEAHRFSKSAIAKIEAAGGEVRMLQVVPEQASEEAEQPAE
jgi:large subunit ribosomal protein L15